MLTSSAVRKHIGDALGRLDGLLCVPSPKFGTCGDTGRLVVTSNEEDAINGVSRKEHLV